MTVLPTSPEFRDFWTERHLCTVTTLRPDGSPHVVPMGVAVEFDAGRAWAITHGDSRKARNIAAAPAGASIAVCCVDGGRWSTLEGTAVVLDDPESVAEAEARYTARYKPPRENVARVAVRIDITRVLGNVR